MGAYSRLDAINEILLYAGESPVADLDGSSGVDTSIAEAILDKKTIDAQSMGLANNLTIRLITPDAQGKCYVPADALSATWLTPIQSDRTTSNVTPVTITYARIVTKGWGIEGANPYFYNLTDDTDVFDTDKTYEAQVILDVSWEDMDTPVQKDITMQTAREYQMLTQGDGNVDNYLAQLEMYYRAKGASRDMGQKGYNIYNMNPLARRAVDRQIVVDPQRFRYWRTSF